MHETGGRLGLRHRHLLSTVELFIVGGGGGSFRAVIVIVISI
jgi:hypothetical protein